MADIRKFGATSNLVRFTIKDKTTGQGKKALTGSTTGLIISTITDVDSAAVAYTQAASHIQTIATIGTYAAPSASNCRFGEVDSTNHPGLYEFQFADARFAVTNSKRLIVSVNDAESTLLDTDYEIQLVQYDPFDGVHLGLTSLPNTAVTTNASLLTSGTGTDQLSVTSGRIDIGKALGTAITLDANNVINVSAKYMGGTLLTARDIGLSVLLSNGSGTGQIVLTAGQVSPRSVQAGTAQAGAATTITLAAAASSTDHIYEGNVIVLTGGTGAGQTRTITGYVGSTNVATVDYAWYTNPDNTTLYSLLQSHETALNSSLQVVASSVQGNVTGTVSTLTTYTGNTPQTGDAYARLGAPAGASVSADIAEVEADVDALATTVGTPLTAAQIATGVWQDAVAGDFTVASSIGKSLYTSGAVPGAAGGLFIAGSNAGTTVNFTGNLSGSVGSVTGAVGSVTGNVGGNVNGNVVGSVGSVVAAVALSVPDTAVYATGTATAGAASTITLQTALGTDDICKGGKIKITSGTGADQARVITGYVNSTKVVTVSRAWKTNPDATSVYAILYDDAPQVDSSLDVTANSASTFAVNVTQWNGHAVPAENVNGVPLVDLKYTLGTLSVGVAGYIGLDWGHINAPTTAQGLTGTTISSSQVVASVTGAVGSVTAGVTVTTNNDKTGYSLTVAPPTAAQNATAVWQDATAGDFTVASSIGKSLYNAFTANTSVYTAAALANAPTGGTAPTVGQIATAVWQDLTASSDFTTVGSIGKLLVTDIDAAVSSRMATYAQPTGFLATTFPGGTVASTTNITAGTITTASNLTTNNDKTGYALSSVGNGAIWDVVLTAATHNVTSSAGKYLRLIASTAGSTTLFTGTVQSATASTVVLPAGASSSDGAYNTDVFSISAGTGSGSLICTGYVGATRTATFAGQTWPVTPVNGDTVEVTPSAATKVLGYFAGQDPASYVLATPANKLTTDASGRVDLGEILGTPSAGAPGSVGIDWAQILNKTSVVALTNTTISPSGTPPTVAQIATAVWQDLTSSSDFLVSGSIGKFLANFVATLSPAQIAAIAAAIVVSPAVGPTGSIGGQIQKIGTGRITTVSPVAQDGTLTIVQGDTYSAALNRALTWSDANAQTAWPDLTEAIITLEVNAGEMIVVGDVPAPQGFPKEVRVQPLGTDTQKLGPGVYDYNVVATYLGTGTGTNALDTFAGRITLASGQCNVLSREDQ